MFSSGLTVLWFGFYEFPAGAPKLSIATCVPNRPSRIQPVKLAQWLEHTTVNRKSQVRLLHFSPAGKTTVLRFDSALARNCTTRDGFQQARYDEARFTVTGLRQFVCRSACYAPHPNINPTSNRTAAIRCQGSGGGCVGIPVGGCPSSRVRTVEVVAFISGGRSPGRPPTKAKPFHQRGKKKEKHHVLHEDNRAQARTCTPVPRR